MPTCAVRDCHEPGKLTVASLALCDRHFDAARPHIDALMETMTVAHVKFVEDVRSLGGVSG